MTLNAICENQADRYRLQEKIWVLGTRTPALGGNVRPIELRSSGGCADELGELVLYQRRVVHRHLARPRSSQSTALVEADSPELSILWAWSLGRVIESWFSPEHHREIDFLVGLGGKPTATQPLCGNWMTRPKTLVSGDFRQLDDTS